MMRRIHRCFLAILLSTGGVVLIWPDRGGETHVDFPRLAGSAEHPLSVVMLRPTSQSAQGIVIYLATYGHRPSEYGPALRRMAHRGLAVMAVESAPDASPAALRDALAYLERNSWAVGLPQLWLTEDNASPLLDALADPGRAAPHLITTINSVAVRHRAATSNGKGKAPPWLIVRVAGDHQPSSDYLNSNSIRATGIKLVQTWDIPAELPYRLSEDRELLYSIVAEYMLSTIPAHKQSSGSDALATLNSGPVEDDSVELALYCRKLVNWTVADDMFSAYVKPSAVTAGETGPPWRRPLWMTLYPKVRHETNVQLAALKVAKALREKVAIVPRDERLPSAIAAIWARGSAPHKGFEKLLVAGLRSVSIPSRFNDSTEAAEFWDGLRWLTIPRTPPPYHLPQWPAWGGANSRSSVGYVLPMRAGPTANAIFDSTTR